MDVGCHFATVSADLWAWHCARDIHPSESADQGDGERKGGWRQSTTHTTLTYTSHAFEGNRADFGLNLSLPTFGHMFDFKIDWTIILSKYLAMWYCQPQPPWSNSLWDKMITQ